jgi:adenylate kinase family enzyme
MRPGGGRDQDTRTPAATTVAHRIHVFGASGSGTTTLGAALAERLHAPLVDVDDYYWKATDPPFSEKHPPERRIETILGKLHGLETWVISGSLASWGDPLVARFTLAVFLCLDPTERMARIVAREAQRYGDRILPGGSMHEAHVAFMAWARSYDTASPPVRSLTLHEQWMARLACPTLRLDSAGPVEDLAATVLAAAAH